MGARRIYGWLGEAEFVTSLARPQVLRVGGTGDRLPDGATIVVKAPLPMAYVFEEIAG
jgi:hypothetical protein